MRASPRRTAPRIPLNTFAISFGLAGLAGLWSVAATALALPGLIDELFWFVVAVAWVWTITAHAIRGSKSSETLLSQLKHPAQGPIAAIIPAVGMLLGAHLYRFWPLGGTVLVAASILIGALFAGWILAYWHSGHLTPEAFHGGYLLPTVGASLIAATTSFRVGLGGLSMGAFAVGIFFAVVIYTVLLARVAFFPPLPGPLMPTIAIILAPPAIAGTAWFTMQGERADPVSVGLLGVLVLVVLLQLFLVGIYRRLSFTLGFWSFTFPVAAAASYVIEWFTVVRFPGWQAATIAALALGTAAVVAVGIKSIVLVMSVHRGARRAEQPLRHADTVVERAGRGDAPMGS